MCVCTGTLWTRDDGELLSLVASIAARLDLKAELLRVAGAEALSATSVSAATVLEVGGRGQSEGQY